MKGKVVEGSWIGFGGLNKSLPCSIGVPASAFSVEEVDNDYEVSIAWPP